VSLAPLAEADSSQLASNLLEIDHLPPGVRNTIVRKADGNPFFLEEVIRNLIEAGAIVRDPATGSWRATGQVEAIVIPDTIQGVIMARIDRLDEAVKGVLRAAAVIGRIFLYRILKEVRKDDQRLERHLANLTSVELIRERQSLPEPEYIFRHALARDATYESILLGKRRELHARVGQATETLFAGRLEEFYGLLAYHYTAAGDWEKAQHYLLRVGDQAGEMAADAEALAHYQQAIAAYEQAFGEPMPPAQRASVERKMAEAYFRLGSFNESRALLSSAVALLDRPVPETRLKLAIALVDQMSQQLLHRFWPNRFLGRVPEPRKLALREALLAYVRLGILNFLKEESSASLMIYIGLRSLNVAEMTGYLQDMVRGYATIAIGAGGAGSLRLADYYMRLAREADRKHDDASAHALFLNYWGGNRLGGCRWDEADDALVAAADLYQRIGIDSDREGVLHNRAFLLQMTGRSEHVREIRNEVMAAAERRGDRYMMGGPDQMEEIANLLDRAQTLLAEEPNWQYEVLAQSLLTQANYLRGDLLAARQEAETTMDLLKSQRQTLFFYMVEAPAGLPFVALSLWEAAMAGSAADINPQSAERLAGDALKFFQGLARPTAAYLLPRASLYQGTFDWLSGKHRRAAKAWAKSLSLAEQFEMPYEQGLAHFEIGRHLPVGDPGREQHLQQAADIFSRLGAEWYLTQVNAAIVYG
jgi:tetratricopeptide (TPR) repeat protein